MKKQITSILLCAMMAVALNACMITKTAVKDYKETQGHEYVYAKGKQCYLFWGLIPLGFTNVSTPAEQPCQVKTYFNFWDWLVSGITGGIFTMQTIKVSAKKPKPETPSPQNVSAKKPNPETPTRKKSKKQG